jgi:hypothetical protein
MLPKMKMRSTVGSGEQRTPSVLNAGATRRIALANQGISTTLLQQSWIASTVRRLVPVGIYRQEYLLLVCPTQGA